eukprot:GHVT01029427.1.p1 GENE.GHVT01029427.1~~GHVT01029427.1.p1  ORF type:complete len:121 (-),score=16.29 GHVT01029427.1:111-473(-)
MLVVVMGLSLISSDCYLVSSAVVVMPKLTVFSSSTSSPSSLSFLLLFSPPLYPFLRSSMFTVCSPSASGEVRSHEVKPLELIWTKFPNTWGPHNTIHVDDLARNFAMNPTNGIKVSSFKC